MNSGFKRLLVYSAMLFVLYSCSKGGTPESTDDGPHVIVPTDTLAPLLSIYTPTAFQVFNNGSQVSISGKVTDDYGLYRGNIRIIDDASGLALLNQPYEIHGLLQYSFTLNHTVSVTNVSNYTVIVSFEDHGNNSVAQSVKIKINP